MQGASFRTHAQLLSAANPGKHISCGLPSQHYPSHHAPVPLRRADRWTFFTYPRQSSSSSINTVFLGHRPAFKMRYCTILAGLLSVAGAVNGLATSHVEIMEKLREVPEGWIAAAIPSPSRRMHFRVALTKV